MTINETLTDSEQDYLKAIYELTRAGQAATTSALAARLNVRPASVTGMIHKLSAAKSPLVRYKKHQGVWLSPTGERAALEVIRHHRLLETFLVNALGYSWDEVHQEAEELEHVISEDFEARIAQALGNPRRDPHGDPIPTANLHMPKLRDVPLNQVEPGGRATIRRVQTSDSALLRHLDHLGVVPGAKLKVMETSPFDENTRFILKGKELVLGMPVAEHIYVEKSGPREK